MVDDLDNNCAISEAMGHTGLRWGNRLIVEKELLVDYFENGRRAFMRQNYSVKFICDTNWHKVDIDEFADMNMPSSFSARWQDFKFEENSSTLTIEGTYSPTERATR